MKNRSVRIPSKDECSSQSEYDLGDKVYIDFGESGQLGPGEVSGKYEFDFNGEILEGYEVRLPYDEHDDIHLGMFGADMLNPADNKNSRAGKNNRF